MPEQHTQITITLGDPDAPDPTRWSMARLITACIAVLLFIALVGTTPAPENVGLWATMLITSLALAIFLLALDWWCTRRAQARHQQANAGRDL